MPNPQQLMQYAGAAVTVIVLILGLIFGTGDLSSSSDNGAQTPPSNSAKPSNSPAPSNGGRKPDADGCVKNTPDYFKCKQENSKLGKKNPPLTSSDIQQARRAQFMQIVEWRSNDKHANPLTYDLSLEATAQRFANELAQTPGDEIWHSNYNTRGLENVAFDTYTYKNFFSIFAGSVGHASTMATNGRAPKVGIGIAQDPVTGHYFCVQHFADK
ncbi:CAP domain-containing protein [uncultured Corynebacterium sp.]|uniref:CAP domain-containing protein n=1 Tax=uncultured Corynebacterium sp. TaxID=159447 RepID=UPI00259B1DD0|nr:CAP domain-containing protein [uncultured Corynebacterium sp.]